MAITEALRLLITADSSGAVKSIQDVGRTSERELSRSEKSLDRWGNRLTTVGAGMIAFGAVAAAGLHEAAQSASDLGEAVNASNVVFGSAIGTIDEYAQTSATSMGLSERAYREALVPIGAMLQNVGLSQQEAADQSVNLAQRAADMASVFNTDVSEALTAIQAGLRGEADPLERFGVGLNEAAVNAKAVELGLAATTVEVDASAKAQARLALIFEQTNGFAGDFANTSDSLANRQRILSARFEDLKAEIGAGVIPAMETLFGVASGGIDAFSGLNNATGGALGKLATVATVASLGVGGLSMVVGQAIKMRQTLSDATSGIQSMVGKLGGLRMAAGLAAGAAGIAGIGIALDQMEQSRRAAKVEELTRQFLATGEAAELVKGLMDETMDGVKAFALALDTLAASDREAAMQLIDAAEAAGLHDDAVEALRSRVEEYGEAEQRAGIETQGATGAVEGQTGAMEGAAGATQEATSALQDYSDKLRGLTDPIFAAMDAITGQRDAEVALQDAQRGRIEAQVELNEAIEEHGRGSTEARDAQLALEEAERNLTDAQWGQVRSAAEADQALAGLKDAVDRGDVSMESFESTLRQWVRQGFLTEDQAAQASVAVAGLAGEAQAADRERVSIPVGLSGWASAMAQLAGLDLKIRQLDGSTINVNATVRATSTGRIGGVPVFHEGGVVEGAPRGTELLALVQAGEGIIPLDQMDRLQRGSSGLVGGGAAGVTYIDNRVINVHTGSEPQQVVEALKKYERSNGPLPVSVR